MNLSSLLDTGAIPCDSEDLRLQKRMLMQSELQKEREKFDNRRGLRHSNPSCSRPYWSTQLPLRTVLRSTRWTSCGPQKDGLPSLRWEQSDSACVV